MNTQDLGTELQDLGKAVGLIDGTGGINWNWFADPLGNLEGIFSKQPQRDAFNALLDALIAPVPVPGVPADEKWHPLLASQPRGNLYLTVKENGSNVTFGVAGEFHSETSPNASLRAQLPLFSSDGTSVKGLAGTSNGKLQVALRIDLELNGAVKLKAVDVLLELQLSPLPPVPFVAVTLEQFDLGAGPLDITLDSQNFGSEIVPVVLRLIQQEVSQIAGNDPIKDHLLPLLGLSGNPVPLFPFTQLTQGPQALQNWFLSMLQGAAPSVTEWLEHLAGLLGTHAPTTTGSGTDADPWKVQLFSVPGGASTSGLYVTVAHDTTGTTQLLKLGTQFQFVPASGAVGVGANAILASIPLAGAAHATVLPSASVLVQAPGNGSALVNTPQFSVQTFRAGLTFNGSTLKPLLELDQVQFLGQQPYATIDLTDINSVAADFSDALRQTLVSELGSGTARHLAALAGLVAPANDASTPHLLNVANAALLASDPFAAIAQIHRGALLDAAHPWSHLLEEAAALIGIATAATGSGTASDPWRVPIASTGSVTLSLAAWNAQTSGNAADIQQLRLGLSAGLTVAPVTASWKTELFALDLPQTGAPAATVLGAQHFTALVAPLPALPQLAGLSLAADSLAATIDWSFGKAPVWNAKLANLKLSAAGETKQIANLSFPPAVPFDFSNPPAVAAALGISVPDIEELLRMLLARLAFEVGGMPAFAFSALFGLHGQLNGLPTDWPKLADPAAAGSLFSDPFTALQKWLQSVALNVASDGTPFLMHALPWLRGLTANALPSVPEGALPALPLALTGSGVYDDPWTLPLSTSSTASVDALVWLESAAGELTAPPAGWAATLSKAIHGTADFASLLTQAADLGKYLPSLRNALVVADSAALATSLTQLAAHLASTDGVVPFASQVPQASGWTAGAKLSSTHANQPADPQAISQILSQIDTWAGGAANQRTVVFLGPAFSDHTIWSALLASGALHGTTNAAANINMRQPNVDPVTISLAGVGNVAWDYYTADLKDDGSGNVTSQVGQIGNIVDRLQQLRPGKKITLVAHSTPGIAARLYAAANAAKVQGVITLGTPHLGAGLPFLADELMANALRVLQSIVPPSAATDANITALQHLFSALDGYLPAAVPGNLPIPNPYPIGSFNPSLPAGLDTGGVPVFAIGSQLGGQLLASLQQMLGALATAQAAPNPAPPKATHLAFGLRAHLPIAGSATTITSDVFLRADVFRLKFDSAAGEPARPQHRLQARMKLTNPGGWLAGAASPFAGPGLPQLDVRVRWAELGADIELNAGLKVTPHLALHQFSYHAGLGDLAQFADAQASALLGAVLHSIGTPPAGSTLDNALLALKDLGIVVDDPHGGYGVSADAFAALQTDAASYLGTQLVSALNSGIFGFTGTAGGPWSLPLPAVPLTLQLAKNAEWSLGVATTGSGWSLGADSLLQGTASLSIPSFTPALTASVQAEGITLAFDGSHLNLAVPGYLSSPLQLVPVPSAGQLTAAFNDALPRVLFSSAATALLQQLIGATVNLPPLDLIFEAPSEFLKRADVFGDGSQLVSSKINTLLAWVNGKAGLPAGSGLQLPAGFQIVAQGTGSTADPVRLLLQTTSPVGGTVGLQLAANIDSQFHVTPAGSITVTASGLPGGAIFGNKIAANFGASASGLTLSVTTHADAATPGPTITILPTFSGFNAVAAAQALLPAALDKLVDALHAEASTVVDTALQVASAIGVYDTTHKFVGHADDLKKLLSDDWSSVLALNSTAKQTQIASAIAALFGSGKPLGVIPDSIAAVGPAVVWTLNLAGSSSIGSGSVAVTLGWDSAGPTIQIALNKLSVGSTVGLISSVNVGYALGALQFAADLWVDLHNAIHIGLAPKLHVAYAAGKFTLDLDPLATTSADGPLKVEITPVPGITGGGDLIAIVTSWLLPLVGNVVLSEVAGKLDTPLWSGSSITVKALLNGAHLIDAATPPHIAATFPDLLSIVTGILSTLATGLSVKITDKLKLSLVSDPDARPLHAGKQRLGIALQGSIPFNAGNYELGILFGAPTEWNNDQPGKGLNEGIAVYLFDVQGSTFSFEPGLAVVGLGFSIKGQDDGPLVNTSDFRLGGVETYLFFDCEFGSGGLSFANLGAGLQLDAMGLPLGAATSGGAGGNPVASSLLAQGGGSGNGQATNPACDIAVWAGAPGDSSFHVMIGGKRDQPLWIGVHASFGPIYIDQIGVQIGNDSEHKVGLLIDGSVKVSGLLAQVQELTLRAPIKDLGNLSKWSIDLQGLAVSFQEPGITLAGGLLKNPGPPVEYDGMLLIQVTQFGFVAVGAYSTPSEGTDHYTSLFVFVAVFATIGIPPIIEISAFGLGIGYNREIVVPDDMNQIPSFVLVAALDDGGALVNDPMTALMKLSTSMPAKRGSFWFAVGLRATTFQIVNIVAVLYIALDSGVEVGILGVARMALPSDDTALVEIELALKARFSSSEGLLSIQAQLTDHSFLISPDCQLTGGFAYFMWFAKSQFLLTMGGYSPSFQKDPAYPDVPRLGFRWSLLGAINIKGESYFALTNTCVMAGTRFEATYGPSFLYIWFTAYCDFLLSWDPFYYAIDIGVSVGATFQIRICIFGCCCSIDITVSLGASLEIKGPPFHGEVTVDLAICSVTVPFGPTPKTQPPALSWDQFSQKYIYNNDPNSYATGVHVISGLLPPVPAGGSPAPGTETQPWKMASEWVFQTESRAAAVTAQDFLGKGLAPADAAKIASIDLAPMYVHNASSIHTITLEQKDPEGDSPTFGHWLPMSLGASRQMYKLDPDRFIVEAIIGQVSEATYHYFPPDQIPAAARTVPVLAGLKITGIVEYGNKTGLIPISKLVDTGDSRPLPFAAQIDFTGLVAWGNAADQLAKWVAKADTPALLDATAQLLSGKNDFAQLRVVAGLPESGLAPMSVRSLKRQRSAPPLLTPLTTGLTMKPVGLDLPPRISMVPDVVSVLLEKPRLRAVLQMRTQASVDAPVSLHTSVTTVAAARGVVRMAAPVSDVLAGSRLVRVPAATAVRATTMARPGRVFRTGHLGSVQSISSIKSFTQASDAVQAKGVQLVAGATHLWDLPAGTPQIALTGNGAARVAFLGRTGEPIQDAEYLVVRQLALTVPSGCAMVAVTCLGALPETRSAAGFGAVTLAYAPHGKPSIVGWQIGNHAPQISGRAMLVRGGTLMLATHYVAKHGKQKTSDAMTQISYALADQAGTETRLPKAIDTILVLLDGADADAAYAGDLTIGVTGATLAAAPLLVTGGVRTALLYSIASHDPKADSIRVAVGSLAGYQVAGVAGMNGSAQSWAVRWNGGVPQQVVPEGPLTPNGSITVQIQPVQGGKP